MRVLNFGSLNLDYVYEVNHINKAGETQLSTVLQTFSGGKGLNQSIALAKSGVTVYHAGAVGALDSKILLDTLQSVGVNTEYIQRLDCQTGHAIIQRDPVGQNSILLYGGANQSITEDRAKTTLAQFAKGDFLILQNEISAMPFIMEEAHARGMTIVLNPSPMNESLMTSPLSYVDYFVLNEIEANQLTGVTESATEQIQGIAQLFPDAHIVLTLGEEGSLYLYKGVLLKQEAYQVTVADTTAAGDTFTGYFISAVINKQTMQEAMNLASKASAIAVSRLGAAPSIPSMEEVLAFQGK